MSKTERLFHPRTLVIHPDFKNLEEFIVSIPERFQRNEGTVIHQGRNELRKMEYNGKEYVIKSFHSPHLINRFVYGIFRPSKAKRSYDHAEMLLKIGVGTPQPVGYMNIRSGLLFDKSYYISLLSTCPYIYDNLFTQQFDYAEEVFRAIIPEYVAGVLYGAVCESVASELAARRTAMDAATKNAGEMIEHLNLYYNRARQAAITQEITEIVAGAEN